MNRSLALKTTLAVASLVSVVALGFGCGGGRLAAAGDEGNAGNAASDTVTSLFRVEGMTCGGCETGVELSVKKLDGVTAVDASYAEGTATVTYDPETVGPDAIVAAIEQLGYVAELAEASEANDDGPGNGEES